MRFKFALDVFLRTIGFDAIEAFGDVDFSLFSGAIFKCVVREGDKFQFFKFYFFFLLLLLRILRRKLYLRLFVIEIFLCFSESSFDKVTSLRASSLQK